MREVSYDEMQSTEESVFQEYNSFMSEYDYDLLGVVQEGIVDIDETIVELISIINASNYTLTKAIEELIELLEIQNDIPLMLKWKDILYNQSCKIILDENGNYPDVLEWAVMDNRPLIRSMIAKATEYWQFGNTDKAKEIYQGLLKGNAGDNAGIRYNLLGVLESMTYDEYKEIAYDGDYMIQDVNKWFNKKSKKHSEFKVMLEKMKEF